MTTRAQLEKILADQRAHRLSVSSLASPFRESGRDLLGALAVTLILVASGAAMYFAVQFTTPKTTATTTDLPSLSPSASPLTNTPASTSTTFMATPIAMKVCTDIPNGRLHVRFAAGDGSEVRGYLTEGETVLTTIVSDDEVIQGEVWKQIYSPIAGWVNARYLCKQEEE